MTADALPPVLLIGAGKMGAALFAGWARHELAPSVLVDPVAPAGVVRAGDRAVASLDLVPGSFAPAAVVLAIKPQMADSVLGGVRRLLRPNTVVLSIMAGRRVAGIAAAIGGEPAVARAMPNTPAAIGQGITVAFAGPGVSHAHRDLCSALLRAAGDVEWVADEALIDPVTAVSGSGPAYVFLLAELLEQAAVAEGLPPDLARKLARKTVSGAGALLEASGTDAAELRRAVTSPKGTTEAALNVLMEEAAWPRALSAAVRAASERARELAS